MKLDSKVRELIAIGASIAANCQPCLQYHIHKARQVGIPGEEIAEAIEVGRMVRKGAAAKMDRYFPRLALEPVAEEKTSLIRETECGCGA